MILLIDNYDSFTYNLLHYVATKGVEVTVKRNDEITAGAALALSPKGIILSPGPCDPDKAGICLELIQKAAGKVPLLGVCLGHQAIGQAFGGKVIRGDKPMHGKVSDVTHTNKGLFKDIPSPFKATRYHSLIVERKTLPAELEVTAETADGTIMGLQHKQYAIHGVQFHPESIASEHGHQLIQNFIGML
jgi:anthranilate synthase component 2